MKRWLVWAIWVVMCGLSGGIVWTSPIRAAELADGWTVFGRGGLEVRAGQKNGILRVEYQNHRGEGYVQLRKRLTMELPKRYSLAFESRGQAPDADLEVKLLDASESNAWWWRRYDFRWPTEWSVTAVPSRAITYAWGPSASPLPAMSVVEWNIIPKRAGNGVFELKGLVLKSQPALADATRKPAIRASSSAAGHPPEWVMDDRPETFWQSLPHDGTATLTLDFGGRREFGGVALEWCSSDYAQVYEVQVSSDGLAWTGLKSRESGRGGLEALYLPDAESRWLRVVMQRSQRGAGFCLRRLQVMPVEAEFSPNEFFSTIARQSPEGSYPKYLLGRQSYFTVIGAPNSRYSALMNEEGAIEPGRGSYSVEPFLFRDGRLLTWRDARLEPSLERKELPIPSVTWHDRDLSLQITSFATGSKDDTLYARYRLKNEGDEAVQLKLFLSVRPFQVNPPWQSLNMKGGFSASRSVEKKGEGVWINDLPAIELLTPPDGFGATSYDRDDLVRGLGEGRWPGEISAVDAAGLASGVMVWEVALSPGDERDVYLALPQGESRHFTYRKGSAAETLQAVTEDWARLLAKPQFVGPSAADTLLRAVKTNLAYILIDRDSSALYPGARTYARAWIRDGAVISSALLAMGHRAEVRDFIDWYAGYQRPDGTIPCCVDRRGADSVAEHDSHGEFIYTIAEYYRFTHDKAWVRKHWPAVIRTVDAIEGLREQRMTPADGADPGSLFLGLMPKSISHEGYAGNPVHSFWDGFWTLRGLKDAVELARIVGDKAAVARFVAIRDEFRRDLYAALNRTMEDKKISYLPGSVELGDFDANATAVSVNIGGEENHLPSGPLQRTFDEYWQYVQKRRQGTLEWDAYTPYEVRSVEALVRLGRREEALGLLEFLMTGQRPATWHHWAEVVWRDPIAPKFIGDMPHAWISAEFIRAVRSLYAFERESDQSLVLAAGIPERWLTAGGEVGVEGLPTWYGEISYRLRRSDPDELRMSLSGAITPPAGHILIQSPISRPLRRVTVNGRAAMSAGGREVRVSRLPAELILQY